MFAALLPLLGEAGAALGARTALSLGAAEGGIGARLGANLGRRAAISAGNHVLSNQFNNRNQEN